MRKPTIVAICTCLIFLVSTGTIILAADISPQPPVNASHSQGSTQPPAAQAANREAWRKSMSRTSLPNKGCFKASYPSTEWQQVPCMSAPPPYPRLQRREITPGVVGIVTDFTAQASGLISKAVGSFISVTGVTSESDSTSNSFMLQLNANTFTTTACNGALSPSACLGWQQFMFQNNYSPGFSCVVVQYWLIDWGTTCPTGWNAYSGSGRSDCWKNGGYTSVPVQTIADLAGLSLTGQATGGTDTVILGTGSGDLYATGQDSVLNLEQGWNTAEFNVFGGSGGTQAVFNNGSTIIVKTSVDDGTTNAPTCFPHGFTDETNNLNLVEPCYAYGGTSPSIQFMESNTAGATATCGSVATLSNDLTLTVPIVTYAGHAYWAELQYAPNTGILTLTHVGLIADVSQFSACGPATVSTNLQVQIPSVIYKGVSYWADLQYSQGAIGVGMTFTLTGYGAN